MAAAAVVDVGARRLRAPFPLGRKKVYLPDHVITFVRQKGEPQPNFALFIVPLKFNKLDFRDYLWNVYNVEVKAVRSFINSKPPYQDSDQVGKGMWKRSPPEKMMKVELVSPFVWPDAPEDKDDWDKTTFDEVNKHQSLEHERLERNRNTNPLLRHQLEARGKTPLDTLLMRQHARELLSGKRKWQSGAVLDEKWKEVDRDVDVSRFEEKPRTKILKSKSVHTESVQSKSSEAKISRAKISEKSVQEEVSPPEKPQ